MARIKKYSPLQNLSSFQTFIIDENPNSDYFRITEFKDTFTGGKNGFLIEGSEYLKESTEIKVEILDVNGDPIYYEPGNGIPEYYEGISKLIAVYIYNDTPIGLGKVTVLGELKQYDDNGVIREIPDQWKGSYNVKWERTFQINKNISNEDRVRFYKRPKVTIDEINKPIFSNNSRLVTKTGTVDGIPLVPIENTNLSNFSLPTSYRLKVKTGDNWTGSIEGDPITFDNIDYNPIVEEVVNKTEIIVTPPYSEGGLVKSFTDENYSLTFPYLEGINDLATALTGSFAKIKITDMKTFVGDAARVKIFRRSQSNVTDFEFVQEIQLESNELLRDIETFAAPEELYGFFTEPIIEEYWVTSSNDLTVSFNQDFLYNSAKLNSSGDNLFFTTRSLDIENDIEYSLDFNVRKGSLVAGEKITAFLSGSLNNVAKSQTIIEIPSSNGVLQKTNYNENFIADEFDEAKLYFDVNGSDWYINNLSLKASQETSFSPDVITFIQNVPKTLAVETFDYRFEFYDINNNFIPVLVEATKRFDGGNLNLFEKSLVIEPSNLYFTFDSASFPSNPLPPTSIIFDIETTLITGSIFFTSGAYDEFGNFLSASEYAGGQYPGLLRNIDSRTPVLNVADFTGSRDDITVQYIRFTGFAEGVSDEVVITRVKDGKGGVNFEIIPFRGTSIKNKSDKDLEIQAYRIDGINRIELKDNLPQTGFSDAKLRVLSSSIDPITSDVSSSYFLLSEASSNGFLSGISAGTTGSGEIDYNATFNRDAIDNELTVYLMDGPTSESILTSIILNDLQDGLASGFISFDAEQFGIKPRDERVFTPQIGRVTGSFYLRGTNTSPISGTLDIYPSMSVDPDTKEPFYYMFYVTDSFDRRIDIVVTDKDNNIVDSGRPGEEVSYFVPTERKQLTTTFTYTEDITSASISVDKTFFSVPDGLPGADSIIVDIDPRPVVLNADQRGNVFNYSNADTTITVTQGRLPLIFNDTKKPGTFTTSSITPLGIEYTTFDEVLGDATMSLSGFQRMVDLTASVTYDLEIHPYFTASFYTQSFVQQFKKTLEGADAINIELDPVSVTIDAEENGGITDFSAANTTLRVKQGDTYMEFSTSSLVLPGTFSASLSPNQISVGTFSSSNDNSTERNLDDTLHFRDFNNFLTDSGSIDYQITIYPFSITNGILSGSQTVNRKQLFSKNKSGISARSVELTTTTEVANYDKDGIITSPVDPVSGEPTSIFLTATAFNITSSQAYYEFFQEGFAVTFPGTNNQFEVGSGDLPSPGTTTTYRVDLRDGSTSGPVFASKEVTISGIQSGANNYQVFLTNPSPTITVKVDGELDLSTTGTQIKAFKGTEELTHVQNYSAQQLDNVGDPIGTLGEFSSSLFFIDSYIGQSSYPQGNPASIPSLSDWTLPQDNPTATAIYKVDIENGRATYFLSQSFAATFEGDVGPGLVFRGPWTGSIEYLYDKDSKRRDAVLYSESGNEPYDTYYATKDSGSSFTTFADSTPGAGDASEPTRPDGQGGREVNDDFWVSLGQEEFFVAAKLAIFEQSFVKETINVGTPPPGNQNANIAIVGGTDEPYIAVGQTGTQGFRQPGVFIGMSNDYGSSGTAGTTGILSLKSTPDGNGKYKALEWDGEVLTIQGAIRQTSEGEIETRTLGLWSSLTTSPAFSFLVGDTVSNNNITWECIVAHTKGSDNDEPGVGSNYTTYWQESDLAAKSVRLSADYQAFVLPKDSSTLTPSAITLSANKQNIGTVTNWSTSPSVTLYDSLIFGGSPTTTGDTVYLKRADFGSNTAVTITATAGGFSDEITIVKLEDGSDSVTTILSNESHTLPANSAGSVSDFSNSGTELQSFEGSTSLTFQAPTTFNSNHVNFETFTSTVAFDDDNILFTESDIQSGPTYDLPFLKSLADLGLLWIRDVNDDASFNDGSGNTVFAKVNGLTNTSGTTWQIDLDGYTISSVNNGSGIQIDFCAYDGDTNYQILSGSGNTLGNSEFTIEGATWKGWGSNTQFPSISGDGTTTGVVSDLTNFSSGLDSGFINYLIKHKKANGDIVRTVKKQSFTKASQGADGSSGAAGAGVVYRGVYDASKAYSHTTQRRDVVKGSDNNYYLVNNVSKNGLTTWDNPVGGSDWESFGAQFESVATDILFATDVYADQTVNIGAEGGDAVIALNADAPNNENPFISIGQDTQGFLEDGIYFGYETGVPVLSMVSGSTFLVYQSGSIELSDSSLVGSGSIIEGASLLVGRNLAFPASSPFAYNFTVSNDGIMSSSLAFISGSVDAASGRIGDWIIDPTTKALRDNNSEIIFDPGTTSNTASIQLFEDGDRKVLIGPQDELSSTAAAAEQVGWTSAPTISNGSATSNGATQGTAYVYTVNSNGTGTPAATFIANAGAFALTDIQWPTMYVKSTDLNGSGTSNSVSNPSYSPSYEGEIHGWFSDFFRSYFGPNQGYFQSQLRIEVVDTLDSDKVIGSAFLGSAIAYSSVAEWYNYEASYGAPCIIGTTEITMADGSKKLAKDVKVGDKILSWDDNTKEWVSADISEITKRDVTEVYKVTVGDKEIEVSDSHGFFLWGDEANSGQVTPLYMKEGVTKIWVKDGDSKKEVVVDKVEKIERDEEVLTFTVPQYVNYVSNDIISHNVFGSLAWWLTSQVAASSASDGQLAAETSGVTKTMTLTQSTTAAAVRFKVTLSAKSSENVSISSGGTVTTSYTNNTNSFAMSFTSGIDTYFGGSLDTSVNTSYSANFIELTAAGIQVVSNDDRFVRLSRRALTDTSRDLFTVSDGTAFFAARTPTGVGTDDGTAIEVDGDIIPQTNSQNDLGRSSQRWDDIHTNNINGLEFPFYTNISKTDSITSTSATNTVSTKRSYVKLPGGVYCQWGSINDSSNPKTVVFPTSFPTSVSSVTCATIRSSDGSRGFNHVYDISKSGCSLILDGQYGFWMAWGH